MEKELQVTHYLELFLAFAPSVLDFVAARTAAARPMYRLTPFDLKLTLEAPFEIENPSTDPNVARITTIVVKSTQLMTVMAHDVLQKAFRYCAVPQMESEMIRYLQFAMECSNVQLNSN